MAETTKAQVLVVEDDASQRRVLELFLRAEDYEVHAAGDGEAGLALAVEKRPDLVITDVMMPTTNGFELCNRLRMDPRTESIPIMFVTARGAPNDRVRGFTLGGDDYLVKPFNPTELILRIRALLRRQPQRAAAAGPTEPEAGESSAPQLESAFRRRPNVVLAGQLTAATLTDVLQTLGCSHMSGQIRMKSEQGEGTLVLRDSRVVHATVKTPRRTIEGPKAWLRLITWTEGFFELEDWRGVAGASHARSIPEMPLPNLLLDAAYNRDEYEKATAQLPVLDMVVRRGGQLWQDAEPVDRAVWQQAGDGCRIDEMLDAVEFPDLEIVRSLFLQLRCGALQAQLDPSGSGSLAGRPPRVLETTGPARS